MTVQSERSEDDREPSPAETWCDVLESYGLDQDQAEALTRIVAIRAEAWRAQCKSLIRDPAVRSVLSPNPTDPSALQRGLELYLSKLAESEEQRLQKPQSRGRSGGSSPSGALVRRS